MISIHHTIRCDQCNAVIAQGFNGERATCDHATYMGGRTANDGHKVLDLCKDCVKYPMTGVKIQDRILGSYHTKLVSELEIGDEIVFLVQPRPMPFIARVTKIRPETARPNQFIEIKCAFVGGDDGTIKFIDEPTNMVHVTRRL